MGKNMLRDHILGREMLFRKIYYRHKNFWTKERAASLLVGFAFMGVALVIQGFADGYVNRIGGIPVGDLILSNLPTFDVDFFIVQGALILTLVIVALVLFKPKNMPFVLKSLALFIIVRSFFISLTHLGIHPDQVILNPDATGFWLYDILFNSKNDFFFSGHTGVPFLMSLVFWHEKEWRYIFLATSFVFGISVLLGHMHYSIDVFAAPFITYTIYKIAEHLFAKDHALATQSL